MTRPIAYITCFNRQGRRVIIFGAKGVLRFPNVRPSVSKIVFVYILTALSFFIFIGCYYLFRTLSLSFYYTHYCKILLYYIIYYIVNTQFSLVAASFLQINYLSILAGFY